MPFEMVRKVATQKEKDRLLKEARETWDNVPDDLKHLVAASDEYYLSKISDNIIVEAPVFVEPRSLTAEERAEQNGQLLFQQIYGDRATDRNHETGCRAVDDLWKSRQESELAKLLGPAKREQSALESMVRSIVVKAMGNQSAPRGESDRMGLGILPKVVAATADDDSNVARFLRAYVENDTETQRQIARSLAAA